MGTFLSMTIISWAFLLANRNYGAKLRIFYAAINKCNFVSKCGNYNDLYKNMEKMVII